MRIFALADPHLSLATPNKAMDRFGPAWLDHPATIERLWRDAVREEDLVLVPGDISWAMRLEGALPDLEFLHRLPGTKVFTPDNHDYWWGSLSKVRRGMLPACWPSMETPWRLGPWPSAARASGTCRADQAGFRRRRPLLHPCCGGVEPQEVLFRQRPVETHLLSAAAAASSRLRLQDWSSYNSLGPAVFERG